MSRSKWKPPFIDYNFLENIVQNKNNLIVRTQSRSSIILQSFVGLVIEVYNGRSYNKVYVEENMIGHKLGEFSFTRKIGRIHDKKYKKGKIIRK